MFKSSGKGVGIGTDVLSFVTVTDLTYSCVIWYTHIFPLIQTARMETPAAVQKWAGRLAVWTKSRLRLQGSISASSRDELSMPTLPRNCLHVRVWIPRSLCRIYFWLSRCYAVKLPSRRWLKQCLHMIGWNQLLQCVVSHFCLCLLQQNRQHNINLYSDHWSFIFCCFIKFDDFKAIQYTLQSCNITVVKQLFFLFFNVFIGIGINSFGLMSWTHRE